MNLTKRVKEVVDDIVKFFYDEWRNRVLESAIEEATTPWIDYLIGDKTFNAHIIRTINKLDFPDERLKHKMINYANEVSLGYTSDVEVVRNVADISKEVKRFTESI